MGKKEKQKPTEVDEQYQNSWLRNFVARFLFPHPNSSYDVNSHRGELMWVPKDRSVRKRLMQAELDDTYNETFSSIPPEQLQDSIPCMFLPYHSARYILLFLHGNAEDIGRCHSFLNICRDQFQCHVLAVEYPGYGICPGSPSEPAFFSAVEAVFEFVEHDLRWPQDSILVMGRSIGTGSALKLAQG